ncbi:PKD family protein [Chitinophaga skermanii]|uniref:PKD family protein n=1 Tax=Chitinophaga skermanii TaxID=331697 RepID=A0A327Q4P4_9BACT|nr:PKD-like family lipoprotein [Chitinophaga skermanii]RAI99389.1 PKD family protein [Chitinophaga skermanii]
MKFQHKIICSCLLLSALVYGACKKDLGNYEYTQPLDITIEGIPSNYAIAAGDKPDIQPVLKGAENVADSNFSYQWVMSVSYLIGEDKLRVIDNSKNLDSVFRYTSGAYNAYYLVTDKRTGRTWTTPFTITIMGSVRKNGWFLLTEKSDHTANIGYLIEDTLNVGTYPKRFSEFQTTLRDATTNVPYSLPGKPKFLSIVSASVNAAETGTKVWIYAGTDQWLEKINVTNDFTWKNRVYSFPLENSTGMTTLDKILPTSSGIGYGIKDTSLYRYYNVFRYTMGVPISRLATGELINIAPTIAQVTQTTSLASVVYDTRGKRFLYHYETNSFLKQFTNKIDGFNPDSVGMDLVWMGYTHAYAGNVIALMENSAKKRFIARMEFNSSATSLPLSLYEVTAPELFQAENFAIDLKYGFMYFSNGSKLFRYNLDTKTVQLVKDYGTGNNITKIRTKFHQSVIAPTQWQSVLNFPQSYNKFVLEPVSWGVSVTTFNGDYNSGGTLDVLKIDPLNPQAGSYYTVTGLGKIIDFDYYYSKL